MTQTESKQLEKKCYESNSCENKPEFSFLHQTPGIL